MILENNMSQIEKVSEMLRTSLVNTVAGSYTGGCNEWITLIATAGKPENKKDEIILECLQNLSEQFNLTSTGKVQGDATLWSQQLEQIMQNVDYLAK